ncbi:hypothetical protein AGMMS49587_11040 [Spirochaetia bacterium]|nr:hypothetical protein AGMMS49587_11040 [Spirochaetia bacterium]
MAMAVSLSAQSSTFDVFVYVSPAVGGTAEEREYFDFNLQEEVKGGGYALTNALYDDPDEAWSYSDFYIDVELSYDAEYDEHIITLMLYNTWTGELIVTSGMAYQTLEEMYDWNLTMIYRVMANAPILKKYDDGTGFETVVENGPTFGLGFGDPYWLHIGVRAGPSVRLYSPLQSVKTTGFGFDMGLQAMLLLKPFLGVQAEAIFTMDHAPALGIFDNKLTATKWDNTSFSLLFPVVVKGIFHAGKFLLAPFAGLYVWIPMGMTNGRSYGSPLPLGFTAGLDFGLPLGPGTLFFDTRYWADFSATKMNDGTPLYRRSMITLSVGYEWKLFRKRPKKISKPGSAAGPDLLPNQADSMNQADLLPNPADS